MKCKKTSLQIHFYACLKYKHEIITHFHTLSAVFTKDTPLPKNTAPLQNDQNEKSVKDNLNCVHPRGGGVYFSA